MIVVGIDPGYTGALVALTDYGAVDAHPMPIFETKKSGGGVTKEVDGDEVARVLRQWADFADGDIHVFIEKVQAMPTITRDKRTGKETRSSQGASSSFKFGEATGIVRGVVSALQLKRDRIAPAVWKRRLGLLGKDKDAARSRATELYPEYAHFWRTKSRIGFADATLIAHVGLKELEYG